MKTIDTPEMLKINTMPYACYVIQERALPQLNDGLKPSQRRILYTMYRYNTLWNKARVKCYNTEGKCMELHPHGGTYQAMARLSRNDSMNIPLLSPKGTMGIHNSEEICEASARYTESKLALITQEFFKNINKDAVPFMDNYDGSLKEPIYLPVTFPSILCNVTLGIAVGFSSSICPYSFEDVCNNTIKYLQGKELDVLVPDFGTKGYLINDTNTFEKIHNEGLGTLRQRAKYKIEKNSIVYYELPYMSTVEKITEQITKCIKDGTLKEIVDANNYTGKKGLNLTVDVRKSANIEDVIEKLYKLTDLENTFSCNFTIINNDRPVVMGVKDIIKNWCDFRITTLKNITKYEIDNLKKEIHLLEGLELVVNDLDEVIALIRNSNTDKDSVNELMNKFNLSLKQSEYICNKSIKSINKSNIESLISQLKSLRNKLEGFDSLLHNDEKIKNIIINQLNKLKTEYPYTRNSEVIDISNKSVKVEELLIDDYNCQIQISKDSYFKKTKLTGLKASTNKLKDGDEIMTTLECKNSDEMLLLCQDLQCYKFKLHELEETKLSNLGEYMFNETKSKILGMSVINDEYKYVLVVYKNGSVAKISLDSYKTLQNRKVLSKSLSSDNVFGIYTLKNDLEVKITVTDNRFKIIDTKNITLNKSRGSNGSRQYTWKNQEIINVEIL